MEIQTLRGDLSRFAHNAIVRFDSARKRVPLLAVLGLSLAAAACGGRSAPERVAFDFVNAIATGDTQTALDLAASRTPDAHYGRISSLNLLLRGCVAESVNSRNLTPIFDIDLNARAQVIFAQPCGSEDPLSGRGYTSVLVGLHSVGGRMFVDPFQTSPNRAPLN